MQLARAISSYTHLPIVEALRGIERDSQYDAKKRGQTLSAEDMGFYRIKTCLQTVLLISLIM